MDAKAASVTVNPVHGPKSKRTHPPPPPKQKKRRNTAFAGAATSRESDSLPAASPAPKRQSLTLEAWHTPEFQDFLKSYYAKGAAEAAQPAKAAADVVKQDADAAVLEAGLAAVAKKVSQQADDVRAGFVRKVLGLFLLQLAITAGVAFGVASWPELIAWAKTTSFAVPLLWLIPVVILVVMACIPNSFATWPYNIIGLCLFTAGEGIVVGFTVAVLEATFLYVAIAATAAAAVAVVCVTLVAAVALNKWVALGAAVAATIGVFVVAGVTGAIASVGSLIGGTILAALFSTFIVMDVAAIVGGKHSTFSFELDEAVLASLCLYVDLMQGFFVLVLCSLRNAMGSS